MEALGYFELLSLVMQPPELLRCGSAESKATQVSKRGSQRWCKLLVVTALVGDGGICETSPKRQLP
jgi:hypothetical protein